MSTKKKPDYVTSPLLRCGPTKFGVDASRKMSTANKHSYLTSSLLLCGPLSSITYIVWNDIFAVGLWGGRYSRTQQAISELSSVGAPSRDILVPWFTITYSTLVLAFGLGLRRAADTIAETTAQLRALLVTSNLIVVYALMGPLWLPFPMTRREDIIIALQNDTIQKSFAMMTIEDFYHLVLSGVSVTIWVGVVLFTRKVFSGPFEAYSLATVGLIMASGMITGYQGSLLAEGKPTPILGLAERVMFASFFLWMCVITHAIFAAMEKAAAQKED